MSAQPEIKEQFMHNAKSRKFMPLRHLRLISLACVFSLAGVAHAGWNQTAANTYNYHDTANWSGSVIDDTVPALLTLTGAQTLTFSNEYSAANGLSFQYDGNFGMTLRTDGTGARTLTLGSGGITVNPVANQTVTIGSTTANQNLHIDLADATRTLDIRTGKTLSILNNVENGGLYVTGGGTLSFSTLSAFKGEFTVDNNTILLLSSGVPVFRQQPIYIGANGGSFRINNTLAHVASPIYADGTLRLIGGNIADIMFSGRNTFNNGIFFDSLTFLNVASEANLGGSATVFKNNVKLSLIGDFMSGFGEHALDNVVSVQLELQSPSNVFTLTNELNKTINASWSPLFIKAGPGTLVIAAPQEYHNVQATYGTAIVGGTFIVDAEQGGSLYSARGGSIALGSGTLLIKGKSSGTTEQSVMGVYLDGIYHNMDYRKSGSSKLIVDDNGGASTIFNMDAFTALNSNNHGTTLDISLIGANATVTTTTTNDPSGLLGGGRVTFTGANWATADGSGEIGAYSGYTIGLPASGANDTLNYFHTGAASVSANENINTLKLDTTAAGQSLAITAGETLSLKSGNLLFVGADDYTISGGSINSAAAVAPELVIHHHGAGDLTIDSEITNGAAESHLLKTGAGTTILTAANTYTGFTYINEGVLSISANDQLGLPPSGKRILLQGGTLRATETFTLANGTSNRRSIGVGGNGGTFDIADGKELTINGSIVGIPAGGTTNGRGLGGLRLANSDNGSGILTISVDSLFDSGITIDSGILQAKHASALNSHGINTLTFGNGSTATLRLFNFSHTIAGLYGTNTSAIVENTHTSGTSTLTIANGGECLFGGVLRDGGVGRLALKKYGCGTQTLTGANTYTGATDIYDGLLAVNGSLASASEVTVWNGALGGVGAVNGNVLIKDGAAIVADGSSTLTTGALTLEASATIEFTAGVAGQPAAAISVNGDLMLDGILNVTANGNFGAGVYPLIAYSGALADNELTLGSVPSTQNLLLYAIKNFSGTVALIAHVPGSLIMVR